MALLDHMPAAPRLSVRTVLTHLIARFRTTDRSPEPVEAAYDETAFDLLRDNPDAFCSEGDFQCMLNVYPGRF